MNINTNSDTIVVFVHNSNTGYYEKILLTGLLPVIGLTGLVIKPNGALYKLIVTEASPELGEFEHKIVLPVSSGDHMVNATIRFDKIGDILEDKDITLKWKIVIDYDEWFIAVATCKPNK